MRTKPVDGVLRMDVVALDPRPAIYLAYDGLGGLSQRPLLRDLVEELQRKGPEAVTGFLEALKRHRSGQVHVYFSDYVSYGIGGGDATAEFFFGTFLVLYDAGVSPGALATGPQLVLVRPSVVERLPLESFAR
ncbi:MAG TPA: hypothetical protein VMH49_03950 [Thermoplasmata archaeon]|nr:hypothetical protein [Thermoplasmata archaeon]